MKKAYSLLLITFITFQGCNAQNKLISEAGINKEIYSSDHYQKDSTKTKNNLEAKMIRMKTFFASKQEKDLIYDKGPCPKENRQRQTKISNQSVVFSYGDLVIRIPEQEKGLQLLVNSGLLDDIFLSCFKDEEIDFGLFCELKYIETTPQIRRFSFNVSLSKGSPVYIGLIELKNSMVHKETDFETFIKNAKVTKFNGQWELF